MTSHKAMLDENVIDDVAESDHWVEFKILAPFAMGSWHLSRHASAVLIAAGPPLLESFELQPSSVTIMLAFGVYSYWEAIESDKLIKRRFCNRFHFMPTRTKFSVRLEEDVSESLVIDVDPEFARSTLAELTDGKVTEGEPVLGDAPSNLLCLGNAMRRQIRRGRKLSALQLESFTSLYLAEWIDCQAPASKPSDFTSVLAKVDDCIQERLHEDLSLTDLSAVAGLSPSYFLRSFKKATGQTPHRYLMDRRLQRAQDRLNQTDLAIVDIAYDCGFASQSHMTDVFKSRLDITPARYRRTVRF